MTTPAVEEALKLLRYHRDMRSEWYQWIIEGKPELTAHEYERRTGRKVTRPARKQTPRPVAPEPVEEALALDLEAA